MSKLKGTKYEGIIETNAGGFGSAIATTELHFAVEAVSHGRFQVHVFHGSPSRWDWWMVGFGIIATDRTIEQAKELIDTLVGRSGAHQFFDLVSRDGNDGRGSSNKLTLLEQCKLDKSCEVSSVE